MKPEQFDPTKETFEAFKKRLSPRVVVDRFDLLLEDLFLIRNPKYKFIKDYRAELAAFTEEYIGGKFPEESGVWFYFPWNSTLAHYLPAAEHLELRTARNKYLITKEEQEKFYNAAIGIGGLSVGSHAALTINLMGGARRIRLADPDEISASNLNRIRYSYLSLGQRKVDMVVRHIYEVDPYAEPESFGSGLTPENAEQFFEGPPKLDLLIEEMDNLEMKIRAREEARRRRIPVIMATDNGDGVIVDVERYDLEPDLPLFAGAAGNLTLEEFQSFPPPELPRLATKIAGPKFVAPRMLKSLPEVGKTLYSWPQLGDAATLAGVAMSYLAKRIILGEPVASGKYEINLDAIFDSSYHDPTVAATRQAERRAFLDTLNL